MKINLLRPCALGVTLCLGTAAMAPIAGAASKPKLRQSSLEIWPGQRTLVILPLLVSPDFLAGGSASAPPVMPPAMTPPVVGPAPADGATTDPTAPAADAIPPAPAMPMATGGSNALATALVPLLSPELSDALQATGKFSVTRPYKFDPLLRRATLEQSVTDDAASAFVDAPSLSNAQNILAQFGLDQPGMVAQVVIQSLRVGGTSAMPTVQLSMRGDLYQSGSAEPFRTINVTSRPFPGKTPEDRLRAAAGQAFSDIAAAFVAPPTEFELPLPAMSAPGMMTGTTPNGTSMPGMGDLPAQTPGGSTAPAPAMPMAPNPVAPQMPNGTLGTPIAPQLPGATPPLGVNVPDQN